jgi:hypothetical protein
VEPFALSAVVLRPGLLPECFDHRADGGGALRSQVAADDPGTAERGTDLHVPVVEAVVGLLGVGLLLPPLLDSARGDRRQVIERRPRDRGLNEDAVGLVTIKIVFEFIKYEAIIIG